MSRRGLRKPPLRMFSPHLNSRAQITSSLAVLLTAVLAVDVVPASTLERCHVSGLREVCYLLIRSGRNAHSRRLAREINRDLHKRTVGGGSHWTARHGRPPLLSPARQPRWVH